MRTVETEIEVGAPVHAVFALLTRFEAWPAFMDGLEEVRREDARHLRVRGPAGGRSREWTVAITELSRDVSVAWAGRDGPPASAVVTLEPLGPGRTRVALRIDDEAGDRGSGAARTLRRLKQLAEGAEADGAPAAGAPAAGGAAGEGTVAAIRDLPVCDADGEEVGVVVDAYLDLATMSVRHLAVATGALDGPHLVPADGVVWDPVWRWLTVPYSREQVRAAPAAPPGGELPHEDARAAAEHFADPERWEAHHAALARRQAVPPPTPEIAEAEGRSAEAAEPPAPTPEIAEAELRDASGDAPA